MNFLIAFYNLAASVYFQQVLNEILNTFVMCSNVYLKDIEQME